MDKGGKPLACFLLTLIVGLSGCERWGTEEEAAQIYRDHRDLFHTMYTEIHGQPAIARVEDIYDPYDPQSIRFMTTFGPFTDETKRIYRKIVSQMSEAQVYSIVVARRRVAGAEVEIVDFGIFGRGLGSDTESISIFATHSSRPGKIDPHCRALDSPVWLVCHWK